MRDLVSFIGPAVVVALGLALAGCQGGTATGGGGLTAAPAAPAATASRGATANTTRSATSARRGTAVAGLKSYKVYNTTESLCAQTCKAESRCVNHSFSPIQTINGYVAGQCQLFAR